MLLTLKIEEAQTLFSENHSQLEEGLLEQDLMDELRRVSGKYDLADFDAERLQQHIEHDINLLQKSQELRVSFLNCDRPRRRWPRFLSHAFV